MDEKPGVGKSRLYPSASCGKEFMLGMVSASNVPNAIESDCNSIPDDKLTAVFHKPIGEALKLPSDLLMEHNFLPRNASVTWVLHEKGFRE